MKTQKTILIMQLLLIQLSLNAQKKIIDNTDIKSGVSANKATICVYKNVQSAKMTGRQLISNKNSHAANAPDLEEINLSEKLVVYPIPVSDQMTVAGINKDEYDLMTIFDMPGNQLLRQAITGTTAKIDTNILPEGVCLLVLRSSVTFKEKTVKFIVRR
jgi:hypothetical protein